MVRVVNRQINMIRHVQGKVTQKWKHWDKLDGMTWAVNCRDSRGTASRPHHAVAR